MEIEILQLSKINFKSVFFYVEREGKKAMHEKLDEFQSINEKKNRFEQ